jgi:hypothetical protein
MNEVRFSEAAFSADKSKIFLSFCSDITKLCAYQKALTVVVILRYWADLRSVYYSEYDSNPHSYLLWLEWPKTPILKCLDLRTFTPNFKN